MKIKKTIAALLSATVALSCVGLTACGDPDNSGAPYNPPAPAPDTTEPGETYTGAVSEQEYDSVNDAVLGFLEEELSGNKTQAVFVAYEKEEELNSAQIAELDLGEAAVGLISVEKGKVEYSELKISLPPEFDEGDMYSYTKNSAASEEGAVTYHRTVYILGYTGMFRFFVPPVEEGETITASYFSSTFKGEDYINCTMDVVMNETFMFDGETHTYRNTALAKATENMLYEYGVSDSTYDGYTSKSYHEAYISNSSNGLCTVSHNRMEEGEWEAYHISFYNEDEGLYDYGDDIETVNDYFMVWFDQRFGQLDHTYFVKTSTGYELNSEKYEQFARDYYHFDGASTLSLAYTIKVSDGRMSEVYMKIDMGGEFSEMTVKFLDFGTTVISVPSEVTNMIP